MVITKVPWKGLPMQDLLGCDNNRTPVVFQAPDNYRVVGGIAGLSSQQESAATFINYLSLAIAPHEPDAYWDYAQLHEDIQYQ